MKLIVGIADMKMSTNRDDTIVTYALGSCLGIAVHDPVTRIGGLLHVMLPHSQLNRTKAAANPYFFVDTGVPELFTALYRCGAPKGNLVVKVAGGASVSGNNQVDHFQIGKRNFLILRQLLKKNGLVVESADVGGTRSRTMTLDLATGRVTITSDGDTTVL